MSNISSRITLVRQWMRERGLHAFIVPTCDPHNSEYVPAHWQCREWLSGFTGSAGTAVVTLTDARLWTDSRYWIQAEEQLASTPFTLMREGSDPTPEEWLAAEGCTSVCTYNPRQQPDPFDSWWTSRPPLPLSPAWIMPTELAGESAASRLERLVTWLQETTHAEEILIEELAEVMWMLNLRGSDIPYNPFLVSFLLVRTSGEHTLYIQEEQINPEVRRYLDSLHVVLAPYAEAPLPAAEAPTSPVAAWRCIKNTAEQEGFRRAHELDGIAMVRFLRWLSEQDISTLTELTIDERLTAFRQESPDFISLSFGTIAAYGAHGAIVHYEADSQSNAQLEPHGLLLLDSGAHYRCGTTDITRTIALGSLTPEERRIYTLVLKSHLQLQNLRFPEGATGLQLDTAARMPLWRAGLDYGHGTGHGVGHCLGVHEGPHQIRKNMRTCTLYPFHAGQTMTIEPGVYLSGRFGVRIENVVLSISSPLSTPEAPLLEWEPLTLCPYDRQAIDTTLLTSEELQWINDYHSLVRSRLTPLLSDPADRQWLHSATEEIHN